MNKKGFTLIELLVVIAIIGILASVVLASLNTARAKGADAAIKANLSGIRAQAELLYSDNSCYGDATSCNAAAKPVATCPAAVTADNSLTDNANVVNAIAAAVSASGAVAANAKCSEALNGTAWAISVTLKGDNTKSWCVDSTGQSKQLATAVIAADAATVYQCP